MDVWLKVDPDQGKKGAQRFLNAFLNRTNGVCTGTIGEVFDAEEPFNAGGCVSQAWSVAEVLRAWLKTL